MNRLLLFAETPRAGRWNYRFLVPLASPVSQDDLQRYASAARVKEDGPDYISVRREGVMQMTTERKGSEMIVLAGRELSSTSDADRERLRKMLRRRLTDLDVLVIQRIDWEREGRNLVVGRHELDRWMADVNRVSVTMSQNTWRNWMVKAFIPAILLVVLIVFVIAGVVQIWPIESFFQKVERNPSPSSADTSQREHKGPETQSGVDSLHLREWAEILGVGAGERPKTSFTPIASDGDIGDSFHNGSKKLRDELYEGCSKALKKAIPPPAKDATQPNDVEERLQSQLRCLDRLRSDNAEPPDEKKSRTLSQLLEDQGLRNDAKKLFSEGKFSVLGLLQSGDGHNSQAFLWLSGLVQEYDRQSAESFHKMADAARKVARNGVKAPGDADNRNPPAVWKVAERAAVCRRKANLPEAAGEEVQTAYCFVPQDEIEVGWIVDWLRSEDVYKAYCSKQPPENLVACLKMVANAPSESTLTTKALEENVKHGTRYCDQTNAMLEFIRACQDIVNGPESGSDVAPH